MRRFVPILAFLLVWPLAPPPDEDTETRAEHIRANYN
jgi:hypothetical protein